MKLEDGADTVAEYAYDGLGRRIIKHVYAPGSGTFDYSDHAYYTGWQCIETRRDTDSTKGGDPDADPMEQLVYHPYYIDAVAVRYWDDPDDGGGLDGTQVEQYYAHDAQFNVIALLDDTGTLLERYRYTPYGEQTVMDASYSVKAGGTDYGQYKGFTGQTLDPESELMYFRLRYYDAGLDRFVSRDPIGYPDGMNAYAGYFGMGSGVDPYGLEDVSFDIPSITIMNGDDGTSHIQAARGTLDVDFDPSIAKIEVSNFRLVEENYLSDIRRYRTPSRDSGVRRLIFSGAINLGDIAEADNRLGANLGGQIRIGFEIQWKWGRCTTDERANLSPVPSGHACRKPVFRIRVRHRVDFQLELIGMVRRMEMPRGVDANDGGVTQLRPGEFRPINPDPNAPPPTYTYTRSDTDTVAEWEGDCRIITREQLREAERRGFTSYDPVVEDSVLVILSD
ncbi:MAG: RHS repeat-associated core domain-containing protein, partial [Phycisphaerales bacterium JB063]